MVVINYRNKDLQEIHESMREVGIDSYIAFKRNWNLSPRVAITTYHQIKGLEFDYVFILGLNEFERIQGDTKEQVLDL